MLEDLKATIASLKLIKATVIEAKKKRKEANMQEHQQLLEEREAIVTCLDIVKKAAADVEQKEVEMARVRDEDNDYVIVDQGYQNY